MANNFVDKITMAQIIGTIFDTSAVKPLRPKYIFDGLAKEKEWELSRMPKRGDTLQFTVFSALSANTSALDPTTSAITGSQKLTYTRKTVSLEAYGDHSTIDTFEMSNETFLNEVSDHVFGLSDQALNSRNKLARSAFDSNRYANGASGTLSSTYHFYASNGTASSMGAMKALDVRKMRAKLEGDNVERFGNGAYLAIIPNEVYTQLRADSSDGAWSKSAENVDLGYTKIGMGQLDMFEGFMFVINNEVAGAGTGTLSSYFLGAGGVGRALGRDVMVKANDTLAGNQENLLTIHWNMLIGYAVIRREAIRIVESSNAIR